MSLHFDFKLLQRSQLTSYCDILNILNPNETINLDQAAIQYSNIEQLYPFIQVWILENCETNQIIGCGTIIIEPKLLRNYSNVAHIEDVVIHPDYQSKGIGKILIEKFIDLANQSSCYKVILNCNEKTKGFYEKCGLSSKNIQMSLYF
jgi:N-acetylglutamate synthase-like GNAT family acetyltransferase